MVLHYNFFHSVLYLQFVFKGLYVSKDESFFVFREWGRETPILLQHAIPNLWSADRE